MKKIFAIIGLSMSILCGFTQVQIKPLPKPGYEKRIRVYVDKMKVVDTHEHLNILVKGNGYAIDFMWLFEGGYQKSDILSAGMPETEYQKLFTNSQTVMEKWRALKPYWDASSNTAYLRSLVLLTADSLYGIMNLDSSTVNVLSEKIKMAYQNPFGWANYVLKEKCGIEFVINNNGGDDRSSYDPKMFRFVKFFDKFIAINSKADIEHITKEKNNGLQTLDDLVLALSMAFKASMDKGDVAVKIGLAYFRTLDFENVKKEKAEGIFNKIMNSSDERLPFDEVKPLQDYMMYRLLDIAKTNHIPVQIHTGLQNGTGNIIENSKPTHLVNLLQDYPDVKFILFHGAYPYGGELATLAKNFRNVYIDMCWLYIISPSRSKNSGLERRC
jgi:uncharacterized protein